MDCEFAIVDVETTGFGKSDRVLEIAAIRLDSNGRRIDQYVTLVNPNRDVGSTQVHKITPTDLIGAPEFSEVIGDVLRIIRNAVFVAHNVGFDRQFVIAEFERAGFCLPDLSCLCTMKLASLLAPAEGTRKLTAICNYLNIPLSQHHSALNDAQAAMQILLRAIDRYGMGHIASLASPRLSDDWAGIASLPCSGKYFLRKTSVPEGGNEAFWQPVLARLPSIFDLDEASKVYFELIDQIIADRVFTASERRLVENFAEERRLTRERLLALNSLYFREFVNTAAGDNVITSEERTDLMLIAGLLDISTVGAEKHIEEALIASPSVPVANLSKAASGQTVCFTGEMSRNREEMEAMAEGCGMIARQAVTKSLNLLVAADKNSFSSKAKKARHYGIPILTEAEFQQFIAMSNSK